MECTVNAIHRSRAQWKSQCIGTVLLASIQHTAVLHMLGPSRRPSMRASEQNCSASTCLILFLRAKSGSQKEQREAHCRAISGSRAWSGSGLFHIQHAEDLTKAVGRSSETIKEDFKAEKRIWGPQNIKLSRVPNVHVHVLCTTPQAVQMRMHKRRGTHLAKKVASANVCSQSTSRCDCPRHCVCS